MSTLRPIVVFIHIPKTGGTTIEQGLYRRLGSELCRVQKGLSPAWLPDFTPEQWSAFTVITGAFRLTAFDQHVRPKLSRPVALTVTVRDPVERARSYYAYLRQTRPTVEARSQRLGVPYDDDVNVVVERWLDSPVATRLGHEQCAFISGKASSEHAIRTIQDRYLAVVTTPKVNDLLGAIADGLGLPPLEPLHLQRSDAADMTIDEALAARLRARSRPDQELFEWVRENEAAMLGRVAPALTGELAPS